MNTRKSYLCIGGPCAGKRYRHDGDCFNVAERPPLSIAMGPGPTSIETIKTTTYVRQKFHTEGNITEVWVPEGQTASQTMELLLETYEIYRTVKRT
jgi:hypothetical protein